MLTIDSRTKSKLLLLAALAAPVVGVQGVRALVKGSPGPSAAMAAMNPEGGIPGGDGPMLAKAAEKPLTSKQKAAILWLTEQQKPEFLRCPMDRPELIQQLQSMVQAHESQQAAQVAARQTKSASATAPVAAGQKVADGEAAGPAVPVPIQLAEVQSTLKLTGLIAGQNVPQPLVAFNHRVYRIGDEATLGWTVKAIDGSKRMVTLAGPGGAIAQIKQVARLQHENTFRP